MLENGAPGGYNDHESRLEISRLKPRLFSITILRGRKRLPETGRHPSIRPTFYTDDLRGKESI